MTVAAFMYLELNILCVLILTAIVIKALTGEFDWNEKEKAFCSAIWLAIYCGVLDILRAVFTMKQFAVPEVLNYLVHFLLFASLAAFSYLWFTYSQLIDNKRFFQNRAHRILSLAPFLLQLILLIISCFNGLVFYWGEDGNYHGGPLLLLYFGISYGYLVFSTVKGLITVIRNRSALKRHDKLLVFACSNLFVIICGVLQVFWYEYPIFIAGYTVAALRIYINSLEVMVSLDPLTALPNRRELISHLYYKTGSLKTGDSLYFIFIDVDHFKCINDTYGHNEGDKVLRQLSSAIKKFCKENMGYCARYGGDEFAIVRSLDGSEDISDICLRLEKFINDRHITAGESAVTVSIGHSEFAGDDDISDFIGRADEAMCIAKKNKNLRVKSDKYGE